MLERFIGVCLLPAVESASEQSPCASCAQLQRPTAALQFAAFALFFLRRNVVELAPCSLSQPKDEDTPSCHRT